MSHDGAVPPFSTFQSDPHVMTGSNQEITTNDPGQITGGQGYSEQQLREKCWFAVSGGWLGDNTSSVGPQFEDWGSVFPKTKSGKPRGPGERFDDVGGVFLAARRDPYIYQQGGREIDEAIASTFDTVAVAPGMRIEIKDSQGASLLTTDGPFIGVSDGHPEYRDAYFDLLKTSNMLVDWMQTYVGSRSFIEVVSNLHRGHWVKVETIPGQECSANVLE